MSRRRHPLNRSNPKIKKVGTTNATARCPLRHFPKMKQRSCGEWIDDVNHRASNGRIWGPRMGDGPPSRQRAGNLPVTMCPDTHGDRSWLPECEIDRPVHKGHVRRVRLKASTRFVCRGDIVRAFGVLRSIVLLLGFWGLALMVALDDPDFFSFSDLRDLSEPHHEHIVAGLLFLGLVAAGVSMLWTALRQPVRW